MFITFDIATAICRSCNKNEKLRLQALPNMCRTPPSG